MLAMSSLLLVTFKIHKILCNAADCYTGIIILMSGLPVKKVRQLSILESFPLQQKKVKMASNDMAVKKSPPSVDETIGLTADQVDEFLLDSQEDFEDEPKSVESDRNNSKHAKPTSSNFFGNLLSEINFGPSAWPI